MKRASAEPVTAFSAPMAHPSPARPDTLPAARIGLVGGTSAAAPVTAGVIGQAKFAFDVWGDTVNTASRLESQGTPNEINVSEATNSRLSDKFTFEACGTLDLKGKGPIAAYFLKGRRNAHSRPFEIPAERG
jgi:class 3 adenylate cyclase